MLFSSTTLSFATALASCWRFFFRPNISCNKSRSCKQCTQAFEMDGKITKQITCKSFRITSFADPHALNHFVSHLCKKPAVGYGLLSKISLANLFASETKNPRTGRFALLPPRETHPKLNLENGLDVCIQGYPNARYAGMSNWSPSTC